MSLLDWLFGKKIPHRPALVRIDSTGPGVTVTFTHDFYCEVRAPGIYIQEVAIDATFHKAMPFDYYQPDEPAGWDLDHVWFGSVDILPALSEAAIANVMHQIENQ